MKGRTPKDPENRRRRNKASTAAVLPVKPARKKEPTLPKELFPGGAVHQLTRKWWTVIWRSPMASRWLDADIEGLYLIAILRNEFFTRPAPTLAAEIRQQETRFGLDVLSRRRLDWRIEGPRAVEPEGKPTPPAVKHPPGVDPRGFLKAVK